MFAQGMVQLHKALQPHLSCNWAATNLKGPQTLAASSDCRAHFSTSRIAMHHSNLPLPKPGAKRVVQGSLHGYAKVKGKGISSDGCRYSGNWVVNRRGEIQCPKVPTMTMAQHTNHSLEPQHYSQSQCGMR